MGAERTKMIENKAEQNKWIKAILMAVIFILLCIPSVGKLVQLHQVYPITENRNRAERPGLSQAWQALIDTGEYCTAFEDWFNDNFQLRDLFIRTKNQIQYSLFDLASGVYVGEDDYLFYQSVVAFEQIYNERLSDDELGEIDSLLLELKERVEALGAEFYCMFPPQKNTVFPERAASVPVTRPTPNRYEQWCQELGSGELGESFIDVLPVLRGAEENYPTYYKTDFHWNSYGATVAFTELVNRVAGREIYSPENYQVAYGGWFQGGQLNNFSTLKVQGEQLLVTIKNGSITMADRTGESSFLPVTSYLVNTEDAPLGKILFIGDSYTLYLMYSNSGVLDCFSEVYYVNMNSIDYTDLLSRVESGMVDYVLFEKIESSIYNYPEILRTLLGK